MLFCFVQLGDTVWIRRSIEDGWQLGQVTDIDYSPRNVTNSPFFRPFKGFILTTYLIKSHRDIVHSIQSNMSYSIPTVQNPDPLVVPLAIYSTPLTGLLNQTIKRYAIYSRSLNTYHLRWSWMFNCLTFLRERNMFMNTNQI